MGNKHWIIQDYSSCRIQYRLFFNRISTKLTTVIVLSHSSSR